MAGAVNGSYARERVPGAVPPVEPRLRVVAPPMRIVKRYANRKLYDTSVSRYVKLEEIADLVRNGVEIKVVEHPGGRDITSAALAHIIFEEEASASQRSAEVLADVIRGGALPAPPTATRATVPTDDVIGRAAHRLDQALNQARRAHVGTSAMLEATVGTLERLRASAGASVDLAHEVCGGLSRARRDLERIARRLDVLHERILGLER